MRTSTILLFITTGFLFLSSQTFAQEIAIDPSCGEVGHSPCVPGLNAPLPEKKVYDYRRIENSDSGKTNSVIGLLDGTYSVELGRLDDYPLEVIVKRLPYSESQIASPTYSMERKLILRAYEDPDLIGSVSEDVFELALKRNGEPLSKLSAPVVITFSWPGETYMKKVVHIWNPTKGDWVPLPSESDFNTKTVSAKWHLPYGQFVVFDDHEVFEGIASWYAYKGCNCAAIKEYKRGTKFKVTNITDGSPRYGRSVNVTINDYGPAVWTKRAIDLDKVAFSQIARTWNGLAIVRVERMNQ